MSDPEIEDVTSQKMAREERFQKDLTARNRRKEVKEILTFTSFKDQKEARDRLKVKRRIEKQKKRKNLKVG